MNDDLNGVTRKRVIDGSVVKDYSRPVLEALIVLMVIVVLFVTIKATIVVQAQSVDQSIDQSIRVDRPMFEILVALVEQYPYISISTVINNFHMQQKARDDYRRKMHAITADIDCSFTQDDYVKLTPVPDHVKQILLEEFVLPNTNTDTEKQINTPDINNIDSSQQSSLDPGINDRVSKLFKESNIIIATADDMGTLIKSVIQGKIY